MNIQKTHTSSWSDGALLKTILNALLLVLISCLFLGVFSRVAHADTVTISNNGIKVVWLSEGNPDNTNHVFQGSVSDKSLDQYYLFWSVDGGPYTKFSSVKDASYRVANIQFSNWTWKGNGPYKISVIAQDKSGREFARTSFSISRVVVSGVNVMKLTSNATSPSSEVVVTPVVSTSPMEKEQTTLYVNPDSQANQALATFSGNTSDKNRLKVVAGNATAVWLGGWSNDVEKTASDVVSRATQKGATPVFVLYNIPNRDCGQYSSGGLGNTDAYRTWVDKVAKGIGTHNAIVIVEPDSLGQLDCLSASDKSARLSMLKGAVERLSKNTNTRVYLDAGHPDWMSVDTAVSRLQQAGVSSAEGFSLNVSNFVSTSLNVSYGTAISKKLSGAHFVIDTSRNGRGSNGEWCNPSGRALGTLPTFATGNTLVDAYLWVKAPGESDGSCNGGPRAGVFSITHALELARNAGY
jgi:endoglucanase